MNRFPVPPRFIATALLSGILLLVGILNLRDRAAWNDPADGVYWVESEAGLRAGELEGRTKVSAGIVPGDRLISINEKPIANLGNYFDILYREKPGATLRYRLQTVSVIRDIDITLSSKPLLTVRDSLRGILAFLHLGIGVFVLIRGGNLPRVLHFYLICLAAFVVYLFSWTPNLGALDLWVYALSIIAFLLLPAIFVHFSLRFPVDDSRGARLVPALYLPALVLGIVQALWVTGNLASLGLPRTAGSTAILDNIQLGYFTAGFLAGAVLLLKHRVKREGWIERQQMKWISYGAIAGIVPFSIIYVVPTLLGTRAGLAMEASMLSLGLIPLTFGYALIRYRLPDVEAIARRSAAYFIASTVLLSLYLLFVLLLGRVFQLMAPQADFLAICVAVLVIALLFAPLRNGIQAKLDRLFYKDRFEGRSTLLEFARTLGSDLSLGPLADRILDRIAQTFQIENAALFLADRTHIGFYRLVRDLRHKGESFAGLYREDQLAGDDKSPEPIGRQHGRNHLYKSCIALEKEGYRYLQDLVIRGERIGVIALGRLAPGRHFSTEDLDLLSALAGYASIALENANLYNSVETKALELGRLKAYTESIIESINIAVLALDSSGRVTSCNRAYENLFETRRQRIIGQPIERLLSPDVIASIHKASGDPGWGPSTFAHIFKLSLKNQQGKKLIVNLSLIPLHAPVAAESGSLIVMDNITEKVQLEDQLLQAEKLSSIGLLAAGIAHEVNTPIAGISSYTQMLLKETPESDKRKPILEKIERQTFRAAEIVSGLLNFSRLNSSEFRDLDINQLIEDSLALMGHQLQMNNIRIESMYDPALPPIYGNMGKLQQVFVNLLLNARDAMPSGGEIAVKTGMNESMVVVDISDTGVGISEENIRRIFDPFFTTKSVGKGTGLGLAVSYGIIQEHGGGIFVDSSSGRGTHFRVKLPTRLQ
jgi:PAS domain S-box-containing protein